MEVLDVSPSRMGSRMLDVTSQSSLVHQGNSRQICALTYSVPAVTRGSSKSQLGRACVTYSSSNPYGCSQIGGLLWGLLPDVEAHSLLSGVLTEKLTHPVLPSPQKYMHSQNHPESVSVYPTAIHNLIPIPAQMWATS